MNNPSTTTQVGQFVAEMPGRYRVFQDLGIDFCCGGKMSLEQACRAQGIDPEEVLQRLLAYRPSEEDQSSVLALTLTELCDLIEQTHHRYVRDALPRLTEMAQKVAIAHGAGHPEMLQVARIIANVREEMESHMFKEERVLFPSIRAMEAGDANACGHCGTVVNPIHVMEMEHDSAGAAVAELRSLTHNFTAPADACNTFRALLTEIERFESDLHQHVHKENNVLFPRAILLEEKLRGQVA